MSLLTETARISDVLLFEEGEEVNLIRDGITVLSGTAASVVGQVLGKITLGTPVAAAKGGGNTGNGTLVVDATTPTLANADLGIYTATCTVAGTNSATFRVVSPMGSVLGDVAFSGSGASVTFSDRIKFAITDGSTDFIVGDAFTITVPAGSGKYVQVAPANLDGSQIAAAVLLTPFATLTADFLAAAVVRGPAILKSTGIAWTSGMTDPQKATATAQLAALGIITRTAYGV